MLTKTLYKMKPPVSARIISGHPIADKLIAAYLFNEGSGLTAFDSSGRGHHGTLTGGATWTMDKYGRAVALDGTNGHIVIPDHDDFTPALCPFSVGAFVNMSELSDFVVCAKGGLGVGGEWGFVFNATDQLEFYVWDSNTGGYFLRRVSAALTVWRDKWVNLVATYDGGITVDGLRIYINQPRADDFSFSSGDFVTVRNLGESVYLGRRDSTYSKGKSGVTMFWRRVLTPSDVAKLCSDPFCIFERRGVYGR